MQNVLQNVLFYNISSYQNKKNKRVTVIELPIKQLQFFIAHIIFNKLVHKSRGWVYKSKTKNGKRKLILKIQELGREIQIGAGGQGRRPRNTDPVYLTSDWKNNTPGIAAAYLAAYNLTIDTYITNTEKEYKLRKTGIYSEKC